MPPENHPPDSISEIQILISQALDGELEPSEQERLEALLQQFPAYQEEFLKQQKLRNLLQNQQADIKADVGSNSLWQSIAQQLEADRHAPQRHADPEFVSAYYDGAVPSADPQLEAFESQLYQNDKANALLADFDCLSRNIKSYAARLEANCTIDLTQAVMASLNGAVSADTEQLPQNFELLSAYLDRETTGKEAIAANQLLESEPGAKQTLQALQTLSDHIQRVSQQLQAQAPEVLPALKPHLAEALASQQPPSKLPKIIRLAVPASVAAILLLLALPHHSPQRFAAALPAEVTGYPAVKAPASTSERMIASAGNQGPGLYRTRFVPAQEFQAKPAAGASPSIPLQPQLDTPTNQVGTDEFAVPTHTGLADRKTRRHNSPSSEEYLFDALNQTMPNEDISTLLGE